MSLLTLESATESAFAFTHSLTKYARLVTREVMIGSVPLGAHNPIRIQSMTTTDTMDTQGTVAQAIRMAEAGCEYIRITAPSIKEARNLAEIKKELNARGYHNPIIADIHFTPNAAEHAARVVEKVRINPGNYADRKNFVNIEFTQAAYDAELDRIRNRFLPLVRICKEYGTAMRIGTNHGSLSDRIMSYYGDTPRGMVESAMEFIRICVQENYYNLVISMKASNPTIMVQAYRLLVHAMALEGLNFPLHLGVTEAGDGEDGRIKSALGIGTLLEDGLGDTIRVSLTEEPELEVPVAIALTERYENRLRRTQQSGEITKLAPASPDFIHAAYPISPFEYKRRQSLELDGIGGVHPPKVMASLLAANPLESSSGFRNPAILASLGYQYQAMLDKYQIADQAADFIYLGSSVPSFALPGGLRPVYDFGTWKTLLPTSAIPMLSAEEYMAESAIWQTLHFLRLSPGELTEPIYQRISQDKSVVMVLCGEDDQVLGPFRQVYFELLSRNIECPVILHHTYRGMIREDLLLRATTDLGSLFLDGFGDGIWLDDIPAAFGILQASRTRISKTEYISCPSCGRTLFDLQEVTQLIRSQTSHLKGVKIAIMGCIVNGPGEMADADYGYVGAGPGKITLYKGKEVVHKNVDADKAVAALIQIIQEDGNWVSLSAQTT